MSHRGMIQCSCGGFNHISWGVCFVCGKDIKEEVTDEQTRDKDKGKKATR
jgi:hypothetical protein